MLLRPARPADRASLERLLRRIDTFTPAEQAVALELIDDALQGGEASDYRCLLAVEPAGDGAALHGYVCFGRTPMTAHAFDLYWIVVDPDRRTTGVGATLLAAMEAAMRREDGRLIRVETSSQETYGGVQRFYERTGFQLGGRIPRFYHETDDLLIFYKTLEPV